LLLLYGTLDIPKLTVIWKEAVPGHTELETYRLQALVILQQMLHHDGDAYIPILSATTIGPQDKIFYSFWNISVYVLS